MRLTNTIEDLYAQYIQNIDSIEYSPYMSTNHDLFIDFRNKTKGLLSPDDWKILESYLYEFEKSWFVLYVLNIIEEIPERTINPVLKYIITSLADLDETRLYLQNIVRVKGFLYVENRLQKIQIKTSCSPTT